MGEGKQEAPKKRVMLAIDESEQSYYALMWVLDNLKELVSESLLVIYALQRLPDPSIACGAIHGFAQSPVSASQQLITSMAERNKKIALALLEKAKKICASKGVKAETCTDIGDPKVALRDALKKHEISLLVMGGQAKGNSGRWPENLINAFWRRRDFLESLASYFFNNAKCAVLVVRKPE